MQALPSLHHLSLCPPCAPTGVHVAPGAEPEKDDTCGICLESLADHIGGSQIPGEDLRPAAPTWVRVCANHHAFHKVCIRTFLRASADNDFCPECKQPVLRVNQLLRIPDGAGSKTYSNGFTYVGTFQNGTPNGQGTMTYGNGQVYVGEWQDGMPHGQGTMTLPDGGKYVGTWRRGKKNGGGTMTYPSGQIYVGAWRNGEKSGEGAETYPDGEVYVGAWENGKKSGRGTLIYADGNEWKGDWEDDEQQIGNLWSYGR